MILIYPQSDYSPFLEKRTVEAKIVDDREAKLQKARALLQKPGCVRDLLQQTAASFESLMLLVQDGFGELSYLHYEENSPLVLVFDAKITAVLECSFAPSRLQSPGPIPPEAPEDASDLICRFADALPDPTLPEAPPFPAEESLYFIDKEAELRTLLHRQAQILFDFLRELHPDLKAAVFRQGDGEFLILGKSDPDLSLQNREFHPAESVQAASDPIQTVETEEFLLFLARTAPGVIDGVEIQGAALLEPSRKNTVRVLARILLNLWRIPR